MPVQPRQEQAAVSEYGVASPFSPPQRRPVVQGNERESLTVPVEQLEADVPAAHAVEPGQ
ncbi:hypothetical protein ACIRCZ_20210 [Leifsonia sp. NPDC102414]|uniref:hypothetical protein n=1 Tax=Leifsonia sp. NPDC102414 TaxID=3364124 RepID=UPI0037F779D5